MLASRSVKPKLSLSINSAASQATTRPTLSLKSPLTPLRSPISPTPISPTARNTKMNQRGFSTIQQPTYAYSNSSSSKSILKKGQSSTSSSRRQLAFSENPIVYTVTPIEDKDYYGGYTKMSRDDRRWTRR